MAQSTDSQPFQAYGKAYVFLTITALCWGGNAVFGRLAVDEISPMLLVSLRWLGVLTLLTLFARGTLIEGWRALRPHWAFVAAMGALGFAAFNALFYVAAHRTTAVNIGILQGSIPVFVLLGVFLVYRTKVSGLQIAGVAVTIVGVALVACGGDLTALARLTFNSGDLLMIAACFLYASYTVGLRRRPAVPALALFAGFAAAAFIASLPLVAVEASLGHFQWPTRQGWLVVVLVTLFPSFLAQVCFIQGVSLIGPGRAGIFVNLVPIFASILAVIVLGEAFEVFHALALLLVLGGIWLAERGKPVTSSG